MDTSNEIIYEYPSFIRLYKDGRLERLSGTPIVPPGLDPDTGVTSKDVLVLPESDVWARIYLPNLNSPKKVPLLVYFHGGGFILERASTKLHHSYLNLLVAESNVIAVSVDYRRCPEYPLPIAYDDSWATLLWAVSHVKGGGPESWLTEYADFDRVIVAGDSAGANIAHHMAMRAGPTGLGHGVSLCGAILVHPFFSGSDPIGCEIVNSAKKEDGDRMWNIVCPTELGCDDPLINPVGPSAPSLAGLGCTRMLICVAEKEICRDRTWVYYNALGCSGWWGMVEILESEGEDHVFHLFNPTCEKAVVMLKRLAYFINSL